MNRIKGQIHFDYDREADVLYSYINKPRPANVKETKNGISLRIDPKSHKVVGFTVVACMEKVRRGIIDKIPYFTDFGPVEKYCK